MPEYAYKRALLANHLVEVGKTVGMVLLSAFLGITSYIWSTTTQRIESDIKANREYLNRLSERYRLNEINDASTRETLLGLSQRLDRLEELNYGYSRKGMK